MRKTILALAMAAAITTAPAESGIRIQEPVAIMTKEQTHTFWQLYRMHPALAQAYFNVWEANARFLFAPTYPNLLCQLGWCHAECPTTESRYIDIDTDGDGRFFGIDLRGYPDGGRHGRRKYIQFPHPFKQNEGDGNGKQ